MTKPRKRYENVESRSAAASSTIRQADRAKATLSYDLALKQKSRPKHQQSTVSRVTLASLVIARHMEAKRAITLSLGLEILRIYAVES